MSEESSGSERFEAASDQWLGALHEVFDRRLAGVDLTGVQVGFYEEYRNAPPHLLPDGETMLTWRVEISENGVQVGHGRVADPALCVEADYDAILRLAHLSDAAPEWPGVVQELEEKGLFRRTVDPAKLPPSVAVALAGVHDEMMTRTL